MPLLPKCRRKLANGCHESYDSRLHFVCVRCVALHLRDYQLRIKFRKNGQRGQSPCWQWGQSPCGRSGLNIRKLIMGTGDSPHVVQRRTAGQSPCWQWGQSPYAQPLFALPNPNGVERRIAALHGNLRQPRLTIANGAVAVLHATQRLALAQLIEQPHPRRCRCQLRVCRI